MVLYLDVPFFLLGQTGRTRFRRLIFENVNTSRAWQFLSTLTKETEIYVPQIKGMIRVELEREAVLRYAFRVCFYGIYTLLIRSANTEPRSRHRGTDHAYSGWDKG